MPTGIDVGSRHVRVATPAGRTTYRNAIQRFDDAEAVPDAEDAVVVERDDGAFVVATSDATADAQETVGPLFGPGHGAPDGVRRDLVESFLTAARDQSGIGSLRYVSWAPDTSEPLAAVYAGMEGTAAPVDPGMAVGYDGLEAPPTGLGIVIGESRAVATLAVAGLPVGTARLPVDPAWFDVGETDRDVPRASGPAGAWQTRQYETLVADIADELAGTVPELATPVPVVLGGTAAPTDSRDAYREALSSALPFEVDAVTVAEDPAWAVARGALVASEADDGEPEEVPLPPFCVDVPYVGALADVGAATAALEAGGMQATQLPPGAGERHRGAESAPGEDGGRTASATGMGVAPSVGQPAAGGDGRTASRTGEDAVDDLERALSRTRAALASLERRGSMTARGLSDVVSRLDDGGGSDAEAVDALRADLEELEGRLPEAEALDELGADLAADLDALRESLDAVEADVERLDEDAASTSALAELAETVDALETDLTGVEEDTNKLRAVLAGLETDGDLEGEGLAPEDVETLQAEALQDEIEDLESQLADRLDSLWSEVDAIDDRLRELSASAGDVPELESDLSRVQDTVVGLEDETDSLRASVDALQADVDAVSGDVPSTADLEAVQRDLAGVREDLETLRESFETVDRVDPETVGAVEDDLDALRETLITRAERLEAVEETAEELRERIEMVYQNSAKTEALASMETETARIRKTAANAMERTNDMTETVSELGTTVDDHDEQLGMLSTNVDNLAANAVTRPEMDAAIEKVDDRLAGLESDLRTELDNLRGLVEEARRAESPGPALEGNLQLVVTLQAAALVAIGLLGAFLAVDRNLVLVAGGFLVFAILPGILSWLVS